jgi:DNA-directed RNA polymerase subunit N (RpoN/RPB10)
MKINCLSCGHKVDLDDAYDDYEGAVKCFTCGAILNIKTEQGQLKSVSLVTAVSRRSLERVQ